MHKNQIWTTKGFDAFRRGSFGNGAITSMSRMGFCSAFFQYDLNQDGYFDLVFANCQNHHESARPLSIPWLATARNSPGKALCAAWLLTFTALASRTWWSPAIMIWPPLLPRLTSILPRSKAIPRTGISAYRHHMRKIAAMAISKGKASVPLPLPCPTIRKCACFILRN